MRYQSVLVVTYGRSGSTLLQALLNSIDGCVVRGENYNLCYWLYRAYKAMLKSKAEFGGERSRDVSWPWFGAEAFDGERFILDARQVIWHQLVPEAGEGALKCLGFKEIRYLRHNLHGESLREYLDFLSKIFPNPAFIFLTRDHAQVMKSAWWKDLEEGQARYLLQDFEAETETYSEGKSWVFRITYNDIVERSPQLKAMYEFLGASYEENRIDQVLAKKHSFTMEAHTEKALRKSLRNYDFCCMEISGLVDRICLDNLPFRLVAGEALDVDGVVVLNQELSDGYSLLAVDGEGEHPVQWGIESPVMAENYPKNSNAGRARFKATNLRLSKETPISLFLVDDKGERHKIIEGRITG